MAMRFNIHFILLTAIAIGLVSSIFLVEKSCTSVKDEKSVEIYVNKPVVTPTATPDPNIRSWTPSKYLGIKVGESTEKDVVKLFGKPFWKGKPEDKIFPNDPGNEIELMFRNVSDMYGNKGTISFTIGEIRRKTKVVKEIAFDFDNPLTIEEAISQFGLDFFQIELAGSPCIEEGQPFGLINKKMRYPISFVYPNKGLTVFLNPENKVTYYYFTYKCNTGS